MKKTVILGLVFAVIAGVGAFSMSDKPSGSWRYKITVTVETPEGDINGSAVREMGNATPLISLPDVGNPAQVKGEAVVVDMGKRGVLFALISHDSDLRFYNAFPVPGNPRGVGGSSSTGIKYYSALPVGTTAEMPSDFVPGYPKLVTFTDMDDPKSVTLAQLWERGKDGLFFLKEDRMEELFGKGVKLKSITLEITDEPTTWGVVEQYLPWVKDLKGGYLHGGFTARGAPLGLHGGNFIRELK